MEELKYDVPFCLFSLLFRLLCSTVDDCPPNQKVSWEERTQDDFPDDGGSEEQLNNMQNTKL